MHAGQDCNASDNRTVACTVSRVLIEVFPNKPVHIVAHMIVQVHEQDSCAVRFRKSGVGLCGIFGQRRKVLKVIVDVGGGNFFNARSGCLEPEIHGSGQIAELDSVIKFVDSRYAEGCHKVFGVGVIVNGVREFFGSAGIRASLAAKGNGIDNRASARDMDYTITLKDIENGLAKAASSSEPYCRKSFSNFAENDCVDFDIIDADNLMQIIVFGEVIYG